LAATLAGDAGLLTLNPSLLDQIAVLVLVVDSVEEPKPLMPGLKRLHRLQGRDDRWSRLTEARKPLVKSLVEGLLVWEDGKIVSIRRACCRAMAFTDVRCQIVEDGAEVFACILDVDLQGRIDDLGMERFPVLRLNLTGPL
jgi:hypothetical protein